MSKVTKQLFSVFACAILGVFFTLSGAFAVTLGVSPPVITAPKVLRGGTLDQTVNITMPTVLSQDTYLAVEFNGEYGQYITGADTLIIPAGKQSVNYTFTIDPQEAAVGDYSAKVLFYEKKPEETVVESGNGVGAGVTVITGINVIVNFSITGEQVLEYDVMGVDVFDSEIDVPLYFEYTVRNSGNVQWKPDSIEFMFEDVDDETKVSTLTIPGSDLEMNNPGGVETKNIKVDHNILVGKYTATVNFFDEGEIVATLPSQIFNIYPAGTLKQSGELTEVSTNKSEFNIGEKIKFEANFRNAGNIPITALLITEIYKEDGTLVDLIRGSETEVGVSDAVALSEIIELDEPGKYSIDAYVEYGAKKTETKSLDITILAPENTGFFSSVNGSIIALVVLSILIIIIAVVFKRRNNGKKEEAQTVSSPQVEQAPIKKVEQVTKEEPVKESDSSAEKQIEKSADSNNTITPRETVQNAEKTIAEIENSGKINDDSEVNEQSQNIE